MKQLTKTPLGRAYWHSARESLHDTRILVVTAVLVAACVALDIFYIPVMGNFLRISFSFLIAEILCTVGGPILAVPAGFLVDLISYLINSGGEGYFPGYAVSSILAFVIYALYLYRAKLTLFRLFMARLTVDVGVNVILGSYWKHILYGKAYSVYFVSGAIKNMAMLPFEVLLAMLLISRILPVIKKLRLIPDKTEVRTSWLDYVLCAIASIVGICVLVWYYMWKNNLL